MQTFDFVNKTWNWIKGLEPSVDIIEKMSSVVLLADLSVLALQRANRRATKFNVQSICPVENAINALIVLLEMKI